MLDSGFSFGERVINVYWTLARLLEKKIKPLKYYHKKLREIKKMNIYGTEILPGVDDLECVDRAALFLIYLEALNYKRFENASLGVITYKDKSKKNGHVFVRIKENSGWANIELARDSKTFVVFDDGHYIDRFGNFPITRDKKFCSLLSYTTRTPK